MDDKGDEKSTGVSRRSPNIDQAMNMVKFRVAWWFKHHGTSSKVPLTTIVLSLKECCSEVKPVKRIRVEEWIPPTSKALKFNVDGSARGSPGLAGMGGVLRDEREKILCLFFLFSRSSGF